MAGSEVLLLTLLACRTERLGRAADRVEAAVERRSKMNRCLLSSCHQRQSVDQINPDGATDEG